MIRKAEILIVGGGTVGLTAALALAQAGFEILLLETRTHPPLLPTIETEFDIKVTALSRASEYLLKKLAAWPAAYAKRLCPYQHMVVWDALADGRIHFSASELFEPNLGHIVEQSLLQAMLWQQLDQLSNVSIVMGTTLEALRFEEEQVILNTQEATIKGKLLIGADGVHSLVKKLAGIGEKGWHYQQSAIIATVEGSTPHHATAFQRFAPDGPLALLPLAKSTFSSIVWTTSLQRADWLVRQSEGEFNTTLTREMAAVMGTMRVVSPRRSIPLKTHHVNNYVLPRCALIGDAAHTLHPLAGQGVNLGLADVASLVAVLTQAKIKRRDIGSLTYLKRYQRQRRWHNQLMILAMEGFKQGFATCNPTAIALRNHGLNWVDRQLSIKRCFAEFALGTYIK